MNIPVIPLGYGSYEILSLLAKTSDTYLCVGVQEGQCLLHVLRSNPTIHKLCLCDTWGTDHGGTGRGSHQHIADMLQSLGWIGDVKYLDGDSTKLIPDLPLDDLYDLSYLDGNHDQEYIRCDLENTWPRTLKYMVVHDIRMPVVWGELTLFLDKVKSTALGLFTNAWTGTAVIVRVS